MSMCAGNFIYSAVQRHVVFSNSHAHKNVLICSTKVTLDTTLENAGLDPDRWLQLQKEPRSIKGFPMEVDLCQFFHHFARSLPPEVPQSPPRAAYSGSSGDCRGKKELINIASLPPSSSVSRAPLNATRGPTPKPRSSERYFMVEETAWGQLGTLFKKKYCFILG